MTTATSSSAMRTRFFAAPASLNSLAALYERSRRRPRRRRYRCRALDHQAFTRPRAASYGSAEQPASMRSGAAPGRSASARLRHSAEAGAAACGVHPDLGGLIRRFGSVQVRMSGTVGGNIANGSPIGDLAPALIALGGRVDLRKGAAIAHPAARGFLHRLRQAGPCAGRICHLGQAPRLADGQKYRALKVSKRIRRGYLGGHAGGAPRCRRSADRRRARRLWRHGGDAEAGRARPRGADRRRSRQSLELARRSPLSA